MMKGHGSVNETTAIAGIDGAWIETALCGTDLLTRRFAAVVQRFPECPAVGDLERHLTYAELAARARSAAQALACEAPGPAPVALRMTDAIDVAVGIIAAASLGRAVVPIEPTLPASAVSRLLDQIALTVDPTFDAVRITSTSGSTGTPKVIPDRSAPIHGRSLPALGVPRLQDCVASNVAASGAFLTRVLHALLAGDRFLGFPLDRYPPSELMARLKAANVTRLSLTPTLLRRLATMTSTTGVLLDSVHEVRTIGEPLRWPDVAAARRLCGPSVVVVNAYGSTEAGIVTEHRVLPTDPLSDGQVQVGRPVPGRRVWISDHSGDEAPVGTVGRIVIEGVFTTHNVELEELEAGQSRFRSGDLGRLDPAGILWIDGRADRMVKVAGSRIEPSAVEDIVRALPGVLDVAIVPIETEPGELRLIAHVVVDPASPPDPSQLRRDTSAQVIAMAVPVRFSFRTTALPLLASGKTDLLALVRQSGDDEPA